MNNNKEELKEQRQRADTLEKEIDPKDFKKVIKQMNKKMNLLKDEINFHKIFISDLKRIIVSG